MMTSRQRSFALFLLFLTETSAYLDRSILSSVVEPIKQDMQLADAQMGFLSGFAFVVFYATLGIPIARLADLYNRRNIITAALVMWSGMTVLSGLAQNFVQLAIARIGVGVGEAGASPPALSLIADYYPLKERAGAVGIYSLGIPAGILIGFTIGGYATQYWGWRAAFLLVGTPGLILALLILRYLPEVPRTASQSMSQTIAPNVWGTIRIMLSRPSIRHMVAGATLITFVGVGNLSWISSFFARTHHVDIVTRSIALALAIGIGGIAGNLVAGKLADHLGERDVRWKLWILPISTLSIMPIAYLVLITDNAYLAMGMFVIPAAVGSMWIAPTYALLPSLVDARVRATVIALCALVTSLFGSGIGPLFVGIMSDFYTAQFGDDGLRYALMTLGAFLFWGSWHYYAAAKYLAEDLAINDRLIARAVAMPAPTN